MNWCWYLSVLVIVIPSHLTNFSSQNHSRTTSTEPGFKIQSVKRNPLNPFQGLSGQGWMNRWMDEWITVSTLALGKKSSCAASVIEEEQVLRLLASISSHSLSSVLKAPHTLRLTRAGQSLLRCIGPQTLSFIFVPSIYTSAQSLSSTDIVKTCPIKTYIK